MRSSFKKLSMMFMSMLLIIGVSQPVMAAVKSPTKVMKPVSKENVKYKKNTYKVTKAGNAHLKTMKTPNKKSVTVPTSMKYKGVKYKVNCIHAKAFAKCKKIRTVTIKSNIQRIKKYAFRGSNVKTVKFAGKKAPTMIRSGSFKKCKVKTVKVTKKMSKKEYKKLKKALRKAGFKGKFKRY